MDSRLRRNGAFTAAVLGVTLSAGPALAGNVLAEISVRDGARPNAYHGELFVFPANVREYSDATFYGYNFRHELTSGAVRELEIDRAHSRGAYLMATDLFSNGRLSTMSHTVMMVFPRDGTLGPELYQLSREPSGDLLIRAPDGSTLLLDGVTRAVKPTAQFSLAPLGRPGTPPSLHHRGLHLEIRAVGKSPFLHGTRVTVVDAAGRSCALSTDEIFAYGRGPESDVFRFESDGPFFGYLRGRCPELALPASVPQTQVIAAAGPRSSGQAEQASVERPSHGIAEERSTSGGLLRFLSRLWSK